MIRRTIPQGERRIMAEDEPDKQDRGFRPRVVWGEKRPGARSLYMGPEGVFRHEDNKLETLADAVDMFWAAVARDPRSWNRNLKGYDWLLDHAADADREDVRRTLGWLEAAIAFQDRPAAVAACRYLAAMPAMLLAADYGRVATIFNSRKVGMVWQLTPDLDKRPLPSGPIPKFGQEAGFGLIRAVPELYSKLAMFGTEMETIVAILAAEALRYGVSLPPELVAMAQAAPSPG
ncbi:hypothetical protein [Porphyrobacter sp. YT40]|uniref:hypothetical protein n=1 Tax=Porphyrobacter sp. YT40 TaxID=2547601 RepID=UPI001142A9E7|nr:hypothetical protein [Porphyrobacter sp. YT40]QDH33175.1 hypothetical protein E2E27_01790 [Porphyrobacter sp. YT40]